MAFFGDEVSPAIEADGVAALRDELLVDKAFGHGDVGHRVNHRDVCPGPEAEVVVRFDVRLLHEIDPPRVDDDEAGASPQSPLHP